MECKFGDALLRLLTRIWNLRISHPERDIITHANDVKSCFRQLKHHPDVMGAFTYIIGEYLFLACGLTFGSDFSPANWEVIRRIAEQLAEKLFADKTLRAKHRQHLDRLRWQSSLGSTKARFVPATACALHSGVVNSDGAEADTPHAFFVDDDAYAEIFSVDRVEQAVAASIEAIFILLGESDLDARQDPVSFNKMEEMMIAYVNKILGKVINTRAMTVSMPTEFVAETLNTLQRHWHKKRRSFV